MRIAKVLITRLLLVIQVWDSNLKEIMGWESFCVIGFDIGLLPQGEMREAKLKSAYSSLIVGPKGFGW